MFSCQNSYNFLTLWYNNSVSLTSPFFILALDRGSQYTAREVKEYIKNLGWKQSFSAVGKPGDNSWSESFLLI